MSMEQKGLIILGNGGHAKVLTDCLLLNQKSIFGFTAPKEEFNPYDIPYLGNDLVVESFSPNEVLLINGIGSTGKTKIRAELFEYFKSRGYHFASVIHPNATISPFASVGEGVQIMAGTVIQAFAKIADNTIINTSSSIDHDCYVGTHCHIAPGTTVSGGVTIGPYTHVGTGANIIQNVTIGSDVLIGAGSLIIRNIKDRSKVFGVPAKEV